MATRLIHLLSQSVKAEQMMVDKLEVRNILLFIILLFIIYLLRLNLKCLHADAMN